MPWPASTAQNVVGAVITFVSEIGSKSLTPVPREAKTDAASYLACAARRWLQVSLRKFEDFPAICGIQAQSRWSTYEILRGFCSPAFRPFAFLPLVLESAANAERAPIPRQYNGSVPIWSARACGSAIAWGAGSFGHREQYSRLGKVPLLCLFHGRLTQSPVMAGEFFRSA